MTVIDAGKIATTLSFLMSVIKSGEGWSPVVEDMTCEAYAALGRLSAPQQDYSRELADPEAEFWRKADGIC